jgi:hypothetical protein
MPKTPRNPSTGTTTVAAAIPTTNAIPLSPAMMLLTVCTRSAASTGVAADSVASNTERPMPTRNTTG